MWILECFRECANLTVEIILRLGLGTPILVIHVFAGAHKAVDHGMDSTCLSETVGDMLSIKDTTSRLSDCMITVEPEM